LLGGAVVVVGRAKRRPPTLPPNRLSAAALSAIARAAAACPRPTARGARSPLRLRGRGSRLGGASDVHDAGPDLGPLCATTRRRARA